MVLCLIIKLKEKKEKRKKYWLGHFAKSWHPFFLFLFIPNQNLNQLLNLTKGNCLPRPLSQALLTSSNFVIYSLVCLRRKILEIHNLVSQTLFGHISINSLTILTVLMAPKSPWKELLISTSHISRRSMMTKISGRLTGNHYGTIY